MPDLAHFNQQVLLCQDDAYTLAWYLLGSETAGRSRHPGRGTGCLSPGRQRWATAASCSCGRWSASANAAGADS